MPTNRHRDERRHKRGAAATPEQRETDDRRRADRRLDNRCTVDLWIQEEVGNETTFRRAGNISAGGVYLDHGFSRPPGTRLNLRFTIPGVGEIQVKGEVLPAQGDDDLGTHIRFIELRPEDHIRISGYMEEEMTEPDALYMARNQTKKT